MCVRWSNALYWQWHLWHFRVCVVVNTWKPYYSLMILLRAFHKPLPLRIGPEIPITSTVTSTVNLLLVVAIKTICSCFSQPLYFNAAVLTLSRLTWHALLDLSSEPFFLLSCVFSEAGVSKVITKITLLPLTVAKNNNKTSSQKYFFCKIRETIEYSGKGFISMEIL